MLGAAAPAVAVTAPAVSNGTVHNLHIHLRNSSSSNWSGFAATGGGFTSISASWVEQTGSEVDCSGGSPQYYSWYEMYPAYPTNFSNTVKPGDHFTGSVTYNGSGKFTMKLSDTTQGWSRSVSKTYSPAQRYSVEVIAEAPSSSTDVLPLTDFATVNFTNSLANGQALGNYSPDQINMVSGSTTKASTSSLSGGESFSVAWRHS
ncbi:G1 family glutamic endopeptidase [Streptacidiphilus pinicola]|uniref:G1 family glutamic endopeptidase n=1 Tax=Streptacidiphilus pinicola TaxID=2219663 RepID=UPI001A9F6DCF|nr:G1 family glutamic endopeptidase [Streptacidiphilus pinicola]